MEEYVKVGIKVYCCGSVSKVTKNDDGKLKVHVWNSKIEKKIFKMDTRK